MLYVKADTGESIYHASNGNLTQFSIWKGNIERSQGGKEQALMLL